MFTGIIEALQPVVRVEDMSEGRALTIASPFGLKVHVGESIAVNGVCLTAVGSGDQLRFQAGFETLQMTNLGDLQQGDHVNLERSLKFGSRLGGHLVTGHVDGVGRVLERCRRGEFELIWFTCPPELTRQMVPKGSIAVDGISLTLVEVLSDRFSVMLIPHTLTVTALGFKKPGDAVNIETDLLAKYVQKQLAGDPL